MTMQKKTPAPSQMRRLNLILTGLTVLALANLLLSASIAGLLGGILILVMVWGIRRGDYPLTKRLSIFLFLYAGLNLFVLFLTIISGAEAQPSALIWLVLYSLALITFGVLLRNKSMQSYLKTAPQPDHKEKKITFFRGGWRDL